MNDLPQRCAAARGCIRSGHRAQQSRLPSGSQPERRPHQPVGPAHPSGSTPPMGTPNATELYRRISADVELTQSLFRQALQDPSGALGRIVEIGAAEGLPVTADEVRDHLDSLEDGASGRWLSKARGGL